MYLIFNLFYNTTNHQINQKTTNLKSENWIPIFSCIRIEITDTKISLQNTEVELTIIMVIIHKDIYMIEFHGWYLIRIYQSFIKFLV